MNANLVFANIYKNNKNKNYGKESIKFQNSLGKR